MILTELLGESVYLWPFEPDWATRPTVSLELKTDVERGSGGREERTPSQAMTLMTYGQASLLPREDFDMFRTAEEVRGDERIAMPFWPFKQTFDGNTLGQFFTPGVRLTWEPDWSEYELHTGEAPSGFTPSSSALTVPIILGWFDGDPQPELQTDELARLSVSVVEDSAPELACRFAGFNWTDGPTANGEVVPVFPQRINFTRPSVGGTTRTLDQLAIGSERQAVVRYYEQTPAAALTFDFSLWEQGEIAGFCRFFEDMEGNCRKFWLPNYVGEAELLGTAEGNHALVDSIRRINVMNGRLAFISPWTIDIVTIESVTIAGGVYTFGGIGFGWSDNSPNTIAGDVTFQPALSTAYQPNTTTIAGLVLCRFKSARLDLSFETDGVAHATIEFTGVPEEDVVAAGETEGTTLGRLPTRAVLFTFSVEEGGVTQSWVYAECDTDVWDGDVRFPHAPISLTGLSRVVGIEGGEAQMEGALSAGHPMQRFLPYDLDGLMRVTIREVELDQRQIGVAGGFGAEGFGSDVFGTRMQLSRVISTFTGIVVGPSIDAPKWKAKVRNNGDVLGRQYPVVTTRTTCAACLFSPLCGLDKDDWEFIGTITGVAGDGYVLTVDVGTNPIGSTPAEHYFAAGWIQLSSGGQPSSAAIGDSGVFSGTTVVLTLIELPRFTPEVGMTLSFWPGCDLEWETCQNKFNWDGFIGEPFTPDTDPSIIKPPTKPTGGGKK